MKQVFLRKQVNPLERSPRPVAQEATRNIPTETAEALLSHPGCESEQVPVLGRDHKQGPATGGPQARFCSSSPSLRPPQLQPWSEIEGF